MSNCSSFSPCRMARRSRRRDFIGAATSGPAVRYCAQPGLWKWRTEANRPALNGKQGTFEVRPSQLPGKLRQHPQDQRQFAYDNGQWFLHLGDTGYRYVTDTEPLWQQYIDEAAEVGFNKIRVWFCRGRSDITAVFAQGSPGIGPRLLGRSRTPADLCAGEVSAHSVPVDSSTARTWRNCGATAKGIAPRCLWPAMPRPGSPPFQTSTGASPTTASFRPIPANATPRPPPLTALERDMRAREPWGTLLSNHQARFHGYSFVDAAVVGHHHRLRTAIRWPARCILQYRAAGERSGGAG